MVNILVVEDNSNIRKLYRTYLEHAGYRVFEAVNGEEGLNLVAQIKVDLMIVDVIMPKMDGYELTRELRQMSFEFPILMITAKDRLDDKRQGFHLGSDDYMVKPIDFDEMLLRVEALLRRSKITSDHRIIVNEVIVDQDSLSVSKNNDHIQLPKKEFYLLFKLLSYPSKIFTRQQLMDEIWGYDNDTDERTVDVHIKRLREKFEGWDEFSIVTVRGLGYKAEVHNAQTLPI